MDRKFYQNTCLILLGFLLAFVCPLQAIDDQIIQAHKDKLKELVLSLNPNTIPISPEASIEENIENILTYYRERPNYPTYWKPWVASKESFNEAENALKNSFDFQTVRDTVPSQSNGHLDWKYRGPKDDKEWAWFLNRHDYFKALYLAYKESGNLNYLLKIKSLLSDWINQNPAPGRLSFSVAWRSLEVARRIQDTWIPLFEYLRKENVEVAQDIQLLILSSLQDHSQQLQQHASFWGGNHLISEKTALTALHLYWPEFKGTEEQLLKSINAVSEEILSQSYPDGSYKELSCHYQRVILLNAQRFIDILSHSRPDQIPPELEDRVSRMWDYYIKLAKPSGFGPLNNASDKEPIWSIASENISLTPEWAHIISRGNSSTTALKSIIEFPYAGHAIMRDNWGKDSLWGFFDYGPHGSAHQHLDQGHLSISLGQRDIFVDSGRYTYKPGEWKAYFKGPKAHNILLINGNPPYPKANVQTAPPKDTNADIRRGEAFFLCRNIYPPRHNSQAKIRQDRGIYFNADLKCWLVIDSIQSFGKENIETLWHLHPDCSIDRLSETTIRIKNQDRFLDLIALTPTAHMVPIKGQINPDIDGWYSEFYNEKEAAYTLHLTQKIQAPRAIAWLIKADESPIINWSYQKDGQRILIELEDSSGKKSLEFHLTPKLKWNPPIFYPTTDTPES